MSASGTPSPSLDGIIEPGILPVVEPCVLTSFSILAETERVGFSGVTSGVCSDIFAVLTLS